MDSPQGRPPYFDDPWTVDFSATVAETGVADGRPYIVLDRSYFYPEGGGQRADRGQIDRLAVVDVLVQDGQVRHFVSEPVPPDLAGRSVKASIDRRRRLEHMQQHTGQHLLSAVFIALARKVTVSFHMGEDSCTIDLEASELTGPEVDAVEERANEVIAQDLPIRVLYPTPEQLASLELRKEAHVDGQARVIEIEGLDRSPCGGTHCTRTGQLGSIHVRRWERVRKQVRVHFLVGMRAVRDHRRKARLLAAAGALLSAPDDQLESRVTELSARAKDQDKELTLLRTAVWKSEAVALLDGAAWVGGRRLIALAQEGPASRLAAMAQRVTHEPDVVAFLWSPSGEAVLAAGTDTQIHSGTLLGELARAHGGKGGGQKGLAQGRLPFESLEAAARTVAERVASAGGDPATRGRWAKEHTSRDGVALRIREALPEDALSISAFGERLIPTAPMLARDMADPRIAPAEQARRLNETHHKPGAIYLLAESGGAIIGTLSFRSGTVTRRRHSGELGMAVAQDWRGRGVGRALLEDLIAWCRQGGTIRKITLGVFPQNAPALALYRALGFVEEGRERSAFIVDGHAVDEVRMGLLL